MKRIFVLILAVMLFGCAIEVPGEGEGENKENPAFVPEMKIGDYVVVSRWGNERGIYVINVEANQLHRKIYDEIDPWFMVLKDRIIIYRNMAKDEKNAKWGFMVYDLDGNILKSFDAIYPMNTEVKPVLRPNGKGIFYVGKSKALYYANLEDGSVVEVAKVQGDIGYLSAKNDDSLIYSKNSGINQLYEFNVITCLEKKMIDSQFNDVSPSISPDGTRLAFLRKEKDKYVVYIKELSTNKEPYCIYEDGPVVGGSLKWSKDRKYLSFNVEYGGKTRVKLYSFEEKRSMDVGNAYTMAFSQDGNSIVYVEGNDVNDPEKPAISQEMYIKSLRDNSSKKVFSLEEGGAFSKSIEILLWFKGEL